MIINIKGDKDATGNLAFNLPKIYFDRKFAYKIGVRLIHVETSSSKVTPSDLLCLNTNLVDRSSMNPEQAIFHFWQRDNGTMNSRSLQPAMYGLHLFDFENATFQLTRQFTGEKLEINKIFLQLEVVKVDPYGRI